MHDEIASIQNRAQSVIEKAFKETELLFQDDKVKIDFLTDGLYSNAFKLSFVNKNEDVQEQALRKTAFDKKTNQFREVRTYTPR